MKFKLTHVDLKAEPAFREKILFGLVPIMLLIPCVRSLWMPLEDAISKERASLSVIETQATTIRKVLEIASGEIDQLPSDQTTAMKSRAQRILAQLTTDRNREVASAITSLSDKKFMPRLAQRNIIAAKEIPFPNYTVVPLTVTVEGGYGSIEHYLQEIEKIERPFLVKGIRLAKAKGTSDVLEGEIKIWIYLTSTNVPEKK